MRLSEMAYERGWIIDKCYELGMMFVEHFNKVWNDGNEEQRIHHLAEMQSWYNKAKSFRFKSNNKVINERQLFDWFFMPNAVVATDLFADEEEAELYIQFVHALEDEDLNTTEAWHIMHKKDKNEH